jgi:hypothetical protein
MRELEDYRRNQTNNLEQFTKERVKRKNCTGEALAQEYDAYGCST